jgi:hypothetical protein
VTILDDSFFEKEQSFSVHVISEEANLIIHDPPYVPVVISDNDCKEHMQARGGWEGGREGGRPGEGERRGWGVGGRKAR